MRFIEFRIYHFVIFILLVGLSSPAMANKCGDRGAQWHDYVARYIGLGPKVDPKTYEELAERGIEVVGPKSEGVTRFLERFSNSQSDLSSRNYRSSYNNLIEGLFGFIPSFLSNGQIGKNGAGSITINAIKNSEYTRAEFKLAQTLELVRVDFVVNRKSVEVSLMSVETSKIRIYKQLASMTNANQGLLWRLFNSVRIEDSGVSAVGIGGGPMYAVQFNVVRMKVDVPIEHLTGFMWELYSFLRAEPIPYR